MTIEYMRHVLPHGRSDTNVITRPDEIEIMAREFQAIGGELGVEYFPAHDEISVYAQLDDDDLVVETIKNEHDAFVETFDKVIKRAHELTADRRSAVKKS